MKFSVNNESTILNFSNDSISIKNIYDIYQNGKKQFIIKDDSLWIYELDSIENKLFFHLPESEKLEILFKTVQNKTELHLYEYLENQQTKYFFYEFDILSKTVSLINEVMYDNYIYPIFSSEDDSLVLLSEQEWIMHNNSVKSIKGSYQYDISDSRLTYNESEQINNSKIIDVESLSGLDVNEDSKLDILILDSTVLCHV